MSKRMRIILVQEMGGARTLTVDLCRSCALNRVRLTMASNIGSLFKKRKRKSLHATPECREDNYIILSCRRSRVPGDAGASAPVAAEDALESHQRGSAALHGAGGGWESGRLPSHAEIVYEV